MFPCRDLVARRFKAVPPLPSKQTGLARDQKTNRDRRTPPPRGEAGQARSIARAGDSRVIGPLKPLVELAGGTVSEGPWPLSDRRRARAEALRIDPGQLLTKRSRQRVDQREGIERKAIHSAWFLEVRCRFGCRLTVHLGDTRAPGRCVSERFPLCSQNPLFQLALAYRGKRIEPELNHALCAGVLQRTK
ncbi:hypothetical protein SKAU_G00086210 [Synaphobranchus kaupii]|uniref:Uncharacterized protein n=1 Tax=Synaphobranchus kaupii TaxID=118154 RepID=A0A9Q1FWM1_SYNKA|nr:hypothetical protein SKAU_G00086210 [Synaphobranchus kaupii]